jgi:hypothetical protein
MSMMVEDICNAHKNLFDIIIHFERLNQIPTTVLHNADMIRLHQSNPVDVYKDPKLYENWNFNAEAVDNMYHRLMWIAKDFLFFYKGDYDYIYVDLKNNKLLGGSFNRINDAELMRMSIHSYLVSFVNNIFDQIIVNFLVY